MTRYPHDHPEYAEAWDWDDEGTGGNVDELAAHHITKREAEEVWANRPVWAANKERGSGDFKMMGRTEGGRKLTVVVGWEERFRVLRPITGWDATEGEQTKYFQ